MVVLPVLDQEWWNQDPLENLSSRSPPLHAPHLDSLLLLLPILWALWVEASGSFIKTCVSKGVSKTQAWPLWVTVG